MKILRKELENREGEKVSVSPEVNSRIWENGVERPPAKLEVEVIDTGDGLRAVLPGTSVEEPEPEPEPEDEEDEETSESEESEEETVEESGEPDYEEIVSGTVSQAKDRVKELESPDYEAVLEAEKQNKDRKTLKQWLESRM